MLGVGGPSGCAGSQILLGETILPDLTVTSGASERKLKQQESMRALKAALVGLTANLIRIVRGAGAPDRLLDQVREFAEAYAGFHHAHRHAAPPGLFGDLLRFEEPELPENDDHAEIVLSDHAICRSALQVVASSLLEQRPQLDKARSELHCLLDTRDRRSRRKKARSRRGGRTLSHNKRGCARP